MRRFVDIEIDEEVVGFKGVSASCDFQSWVGEPFARGIMGKNITIMADEEKSYNCLKGAEMQVKKSIKIPVHYDTTNTKIGILDRLTSRITYCIRLISSLIDENTELVRTVVIRALIKNTDINNGKVCVWLEVSDELLTKAATENVQLD